MNAEMNERKIDARAAGDEPGAAARIAATPKPGGDGAARNEAGADALDLALEEIDPTQRLKEGFTGQER